MPFFAHIAREYLLFQNKFSTFAKKKEEMINVFCKKFFRWLKENNLYVKWMRNHAREEIIFNLKTTTINPAYFVSSKMWSFDWSETPEGGRYWERIDENWRRHLYSDEDWRRHFAPRNLKFFEDVIYKEIHRE